MYEKPKLVPVGEVEEVVLGIYPSGGDLDGNHVIIDFEFGEDEVSDR
jgi:hypothetical protein